VWVEVDSIPANPGTANIYIYYGNPGATSASSGDNTFLLFDHFNGSSLDTTKWNVVVRIAYGSYSIANSKLTLSANINGGIGIASKTAASGNMKLEAKKLSVKNRPKPAYSFPPVSLLTSNTIHAYDPGVSGYVTEWYESNPMYLWKRNSGSWVQIGPSSSEIMVLDVQKNQALQLDDTYVTWLINNTQKIQAMDNRYRDNLYAQITSYAGSIIEVDYVYLRRFANPEPAWGS
jgi:hypothetical protein